MSDDLGKEIASKALNIEWRHTESAARQVARFAADRIKELEAKIARLEALIAQCHGMADQGVDAPNAAYRWCERILEVCERGAALDEYEMWARQYGGKPAQPELTGGEK